jgi:hypothetical protein
METTTFSVAPLAWGGCQIKVVVLSSPRRRLDPPGRRPLLAWIRAPVWRGRAGDAPRPALPYRSRGRRAHRARRAPRKAKRWAESIPVMSSGTPPLPLRRRPLLPTCPFSDRPQTPTAPHSIFSSSPHHRQWCLGFEQALCGGGTSGFDVGSPLPLWRRPSTRAPLLPLQPAPPWLMQAEGSQASSLVQDGPIPPSSPWAPVARASRSGGALICRWCPR